MTVTSYCGVTACCDVTVTVTVTVTDAVMEAADWLPPGPVTDLLLPLIAAICRAASSIASAIEEFKHLVGSPWITLTRGSSSKKKRREDLERQRRLAAAIDMEGGSRGVGRVMGAGSRGVIKSAGFEASANLTQASDC